MGSAVRWEYKTVAVPSMDEWLIGETELAIRATTGDGPSEVISKHARFMDTTLTELGKAGWELVSLWESEPSQLFPYAVRWMTFKRQVG